MGYLYAKVYLGEQNFKYVCGFFFNEIMGWAKGVYGAPHASVDRMNPMD